MQNSTDMLLFSSEGGLMWLVGQCIPPPKLLVPAIISSGGRRACSRVLKSSSGRVGCAPGILDKNSCNLV